MTQFSVKNNIDELQMGILLQLLKSWNMEVEVNNEDVATTKKHKLFSKTRGMWANRDIDVKKLRKEAYERRTKYYDNATL